MALCTQTEAVHVYIPRVFSSSLNFCTDSAHLTFSEASPPTSLLAREMVPAVASASCWHLSFAAVALSNSAVSSARLSSSSYIKFIVQQNINYYAAHIKYVIQRLAGRSRD